MGDEKKSLGVSEFIAGCMGGFAQVVIGQPFDIVKVRLQTQKVGETIYTGAFDCLKKIVKHEGGALSLWKGSLPPLVGVGAATSIQFGVNENTKAIMKNITKAKELSMGHLAICGSIAGIVNSFISTPAEHIRIRMQSQGTMANPPYKSSMDCIKKIYGQHGLRGIYKGFIPTLWRETFAYAVYFSMYDWTIKKLMGNSKEKPQTHKVAFSGAFAGVCFWFSVFPLDAIKTKIQIDSFRSPQYKSMMDCIKQINKTQGFNGFWRGLSPCLIRAIPVNSGTFIVYEATLGALHRQPKELKGLSLI
jgi:solute carrier family 25 carnitine/acylcarnitine transporter 20/29